MSRVFTSIRRAVVVGMFLASMSSTARAQSLHIDHRTLDPLPSELLRRMSVPVGLDQRGEPWSMVDRAASCLELDFSASTFSLAAFQEERPADGPEEPAERLNRIGLFVGATTKDADTGFTLGLEYERRLTDLIGLGVVTEWSPDGSSSRPSRLCSSILLEISRSRLPPAWPSNMGTHTSSSASVLDGSSSCRRD